MHIFGDQTYNTATSIQNNFQIHNMTLNIMHYHSVSNINLTTDLFILQTCFILLRLQAFFRRRLRLMFGKDS